MAEAILRRPEVKRRCGISNTNMHAAIAAGTFPQPVELGPRAVGWLESEIESWLSSRPRKVKEKNQAMAALRAQPRKPKKAKKKKIKKASRPTPSKSRESTQTQGAPA